MLIWKIWGIKMFDNLSQREKILLILAVIIIFTSIYYFYIFQAQNLKLKELKTIKIEKNSTLKIATEMTKKLPEIEKRYNEYLKRQEMKGIKPLGKSVTDLLENIETVAVNNQIKLNSFKPVMKNDLVIMSFSVSGAYLNLSDFFNSLRQWKNWFEFDALSLKPAGEKISADIIIIFHKDGYYGGDAG